MVNIGKILGFIGLIIVVMLAVGAGVFVYSYVQTAPDKMEGVWNGTVQYNGVYYDSRFMFYNDSTCTILLYPKAGLTYNLSQPTTEPVVRDHATWETEGDHYNLIYPDGKVRLERTNVPHTLRLSETARDGYKTPFAGYVTKNTDYVAEFGDIYTRLK